MRTHETPRVYVACLACYNDGKLHGEWMDATDAEEMDEKRQALQAQCGHTDNDWAIHDHEGFNDLIGEYDSFATVAELGAALEEHGEPLALYMDRIGREYALQDVGKTVSDFEENYQGSHNSLEDWAEDFLTDTGALSEVPESLRSYIDYAAWARDAELGGDIFSAEDSSGMVHIFWNR